MTEKLNLSQIREQLQRSTFSHGYWLNRVFHSRLATPIIWLLLGRATANQVTVFWVILGVFSCLLFTLGNYWVNFSALILIQLHIILDYVDGPLARAAKHPPANPATGVYIERVGHDLIYTIFFFCIAVGESGRCCPKRMLIAGFCASIGYFFYKYTRRAKIYCLLTKKFPRPQSGPAVSKAEKEKPFLKTLYAKTQFIWDPVYFTIIAMVFLLLNRLDIFVFFYAITYPVQFLLSYIHHARGSNAWVYKWLESK